MKISFHQFICTLLTLWLGAYDCLRSCFRRTRTFANEVVPGTVPHHRGIKTLRAEAALTAHSFVKLGTGEGQVLPAGAGDQPIGWVIDDAATGEDIAVHLMGSAPITAVVRAAAAIPHSANVYTAADGKCTVVPTAPGTYWRAGIALTNATADGDEIEVDPTAPVAVTIT